MRTSASFIELLEDRIAPATIVNPTTITYQDVDGDTVTIKLSKSNLVTTAAGNLDTVFHFSLVEDGSNMTPQQLQTVNLAALGTAAEGLGITITAKRDAVHGGDGSVNVGYIDALGIDLGTVKIVGDLGRIDAGTNSTKTPAIKSLDVLSMGLYGTSTQDVGASLSSTVHGPVTTLTIHGDAVGINLSVSTALATQSDIGTLKIGGSLEGIAVANSGQITVAHKLGSVTIGGDLVGSGSNDTGQIVSSGGIGAIKISGSILGGGGVGSGAILANGPASTIKSIFIGENLAGGDGGLSGEVYATISIGPITIDDSLLGGNGTQSGAINAGAVQQPHQSIVNPGIISAITIVGDIVGGNGPGSAQIGDQVAVSNGQSDLIVKKVLVEGSVIGNAAGTAAISGGILDSVTIVGSLIGGPTIGSAGSDEFSGLVFAPALIGNLTIGGSLIGHDDNSGTIETFELDQLQIGHDMNGGEGSLSGSINVSLLGKMFVGGSIRSGTGSLSGTITSSASPGVTEFTGLIGSITVGGSIVGTAANPIQIFAEGTPGTASPAALGSLNVGGSVTYLQVLGGYSGDGMGVENADAHIGAIKVGRDWIASSVSAGVVAGSQGFGSADDHLGTAGLGTPNLSSIASITIGQQILGTAGGSDHFGFAAQSIGAIKIGGVVYPKFTTVVTSEDLGSTGDVTAHLV